MHFGIRLQLFYNKKEWLIFIAICAFIATLQLAFEFKNWQNFSALPYKQISGEVVGVSFKHAKNGTPFETVYIKTDERKFCFWVKQESRDLLFHNVTFAIASSKIDFKNWLGGGCSNIFSLEDLGENRDFSIKKFLYEQISNEHKDSEIVKELYLSLYLNIPVDEFLQTKISDYGLAAVLALSGLNVALLWGMLWLILSPIYTFFQARYFPYRSKSLDIGTAILIFLAIYLFVTDFAPSFARAVFMAAFAFYLKERGFKLFSYSSLAVCCFVLLAIFPDFIISIGFWLSVVAVLQIFTFQSNTNFKTWQLFFIFPIWIFIVMMPITHLFFTEFSGSSLFSPVYNVVFDYFYPVSIILHLLGYGNIFDTILSNWLGIESMKRAFFVSPYWFGLVYLGCIVASAKYRLFFIAYNLLSVLFLVLSFLMI